MSIPTDFSAVESNDYSYLFYARSNGTIALLKSSTTQEDNDTNYKASSIVASGNVVSTSAPRISAVSYKDKEGRNQIRVYYVGPKQAGKGFRLMELCQTNDGDWFDGSLNKNNITCDEKTLLSANVEWGKGDLKIFFQDPDGTPGVAWVVLGQTAWASHLLEPVPFKW